MSEYIEGEDVEKMLEDAQIISDGEYSGYCTEDVNLSNIPIANVIPTKEMVERMRGEWIYKPTGRYGQRQAWCKACGKHSGIGGIKSNQHKPFCPNCGAPMTDEAVDMMLEKWKEAVDNG